MKTVTVFFAFLICLTSLVSASGFWNLDRTREEAPAITTWEKGPALYVNPQTGEEKSGGGYLGPEDWRRVLPNNPLVFSWANALYKGPRYQIWLEKKDFGTGTYWFARHYMFFTNQVGAWYNIGTRENPDFRPLYVMFEKWILDGKGNLPLFEGDFKLLYDSRADVNRDGTIDIRDLTEVSRKLIPGVWQKVSEGDPLDVTGNGYLTEDDLWIISGCLGGTADVPAEKAIPYIKNVSLAPAAPARSAPATIWGKIKLGER